jgi:hypothetical protein
MAPPFINSTGLVTKILDEIIEASQPERFTQDFLADKLGYPVREMKMKPATRRTGDFWSTPITGQFQSPPGFRIRAKTGPAITGMAQSCVFRSVCFALWQRAVCLKRLDCIPPNA